MKLKSLLTCAPVLACALCGCGDGDERGASADARFEPFVEKNSAVAFAANLDKQQFFEVLDSYVEFVSGIELIPGKTVNEVKDAVEAFKADPFAKVPREFRRFWRDSGLEDAEFHWATVSWPDIEVVGGVPQFDGLSVAIAAKVDVDQLISTLGETCADVVSFEKTKLNGEDAWHVVPRRRSDADGMKSMGIDPYIASLDGRLLLGAYSKAALSHLVRHYRKGTRKKSALGGFSAAKGEVARLHIDLAALWKALDENIPADEFKKLDMIVPEGSRIVRGLKSLDLKVDVARNGRLASSVLIKTASADDAEQLRTFAKAALLPLRAQASQIGGWLAKELKNLKIEGSGDEVELQNIDIVFIAMAAVVPNITAAIGKAQANEMSIKGRTLFMSMAAANIDREARGLESLWPRTFVKDGSDAGDISGRAFTSAARYFNALFDMDAHGTDKWHPYVDAGLDVLGKDAVVNGKISPAWLGWCIAANVTDAMPDFTPVLISANFNPALLPGKGSYETNRTKALALGPRSGAAKSLFGDRCVVVVRKSGAVEVIDAKKLTYAALYKGYVPPVYLTPTGIAKPSGQ